MKKYNYFFTFIFISCLGVILHFTYNLSGNNYIVGLFSAVNESTWEHLKLLFFPVIILTIIQYFISKETIINYLPTRTIGLLIGMFFIVISFYSLWGIIGKILGYLNIAIYFIGVILFIIFEKNLSIKSTPTKIKISIIVLFSLTILFFIFTYFAPNLGIFYDLSLHPKC